MQRQSISKFAALCLIVQTLFVCATTFGGTETTDADALGALKPPESLAQLVKTFPGSTGESADKSSQYFIVQRHLDQYAVAVGSNLTVQAITTILDQTKQNEVLQANVFFWLHQSGVVNKLNAQDRLSAYRHIEKVVSQSQGESFQVGVGLLRRLLEPEGVNAMGSAEEAKVAGTAIAEMTREHLIQGIHSDKDEAITRSVLEDVRKLRKRDMLDAKSYSELLRSCTTNVSMRSSIRVRTATLLIQESTNSAEIARLLQAEAENPRNDEAVRKEFGGLINKGKP